MSDSLQLQKHVKFLIRHLNVFPEQYSSLDTNKITLLFFAVSALDLVGELDTLLTKERRKAIIDWIYRLQITSDSGNYWCGFRGGLGCVYSDDKGDVCSIYDAANLAQTYSALLSLAILGDDLSKVDRCAILNTISKSQKDDGSFWGQGKDSESDMRFVFCATAICHILNDDNAINWSRLSQFIRASLNYDGGIGQGPGDESHGGSTYCAIASLALSNRLWNESVLSRKEIDRLIKWAVWKQERGFHGRAHKPDDSCYAFWIGATLEILNAHPFINDIYLREFLMIAQHEHLGGFCKIPEKGGFPDLLHTYFSLAALSLLREPGFSPINPSLNVTRHVCERIKNHQIFNNS